MTDCILIGFCLNCRLEDEVQLEDFTGRAEHIITHQLLIIC